MKPTPRSGAAPAAALAARSRAEMVDALRPRPELGLPDVARLSALLRSFEEQRRPLRVGVLRTHSTELLRPHWAFESLLHGFDLELYEGPYGSLLQEAQAKSGLLEHAPDVVYVFCRPEDLAPGFRAPLSLRSAAEREQLVGRAVDFLAGVLDALRRSLPALVVVSILPRMAPPELGLYDAMIEDSEASLLDALKRTLAARMQASLSDVLLHDMDQLVEEVGRRRLFDRRLWHASRFPFSSAGAQHVARRLMAYAVRRLEPPAKCIVLDADNTLWGGIVGEDGREGILLGPEHPGSLYVEFQERLLRLRQRGLLLALCSKNNEADVLEVLRSHPHQVLKEEHFAARRVDWQAKPDNLRALARDLNLGLESFVFVDDSPHECLSVRAQLPEVTVVRAPSDPLALPGCLDEEPRLEVLSLTSEDRRRSQMYAEESQRARLAGDAVDLDSYLRSLEMVMSVWIDHEPSVPRIAQLTQKTNQFNLTTRRYGEADVRAFMQEPGAFVQAFSLSDVFGDSGLVGVAIVRLPEPTTAEVDTFLMSCRVIGRQAELAFLRAVLDECAARGATCVRASYAETAKNAQVADFWPRNAFEELAPGRYELDLARRRELAEPPIEVRRTDG